jgi:hypothetical protein
MYWEGILLKSKKTENTKVNMWTNKMDTYYKNVSKEELKKDLKTAGFKIK